jgi:hypothetical protein
MDFLTKLRIPYAIGALVLWNFILGAGLLLSKGRYFGLAVAVALVLFGGVSLRLSSQAGGAILRIYRTPGPTNRGSLDPIRARLRSYGAAFLIAGCLAFAAQWATTIGTR